MRFAATPDQDLIVRKAGKAGWSLYASPACLARLLVVHPDLVRVARVRATMDFLLELFHRDAALWSGA